MMQSGGRGRGGGRGGGNGTFQQQQQYGGPTNQPSFGQASMGSDTTGGPFNTSFSINRSRPRGGLQSGTNMPPPSQPQVTMQQQEPPIQNTEVVSGTGFVSGTGYPRGAGRGDRLLHYTSGGGGGLRTPTPSFTNVTPTPTVPVMRAPANLPTIQPPPDFHMSSMSQMQEVHQQPPSIETQPQMVPAVNGFGSIDVHVQQVCPCCRDMAANIEELARGMSALFAKYADQFHASRGESGSQNLP